MSTRWNRMAAYGRWSPVFVLVAVLSTGCMNPASLAMMIAPFKDDKEPAKVSLTKKTKEPTVVITAAFSNPLETRPEFQTADRELCEKLAQMLKGRFEKNKEKIKLIPYYKVKSYLNKDVDGVLVSRREVGKHFNADFVINLDITSMSFYEEGSYRQLFTGNTEIMVTVFDIHQDEGEGPIHEQVYRLRYPDSGPIMAGESSVLEFRSMFLAAVAGDMSKIFAPYDTDEKYQMKSAPRNLP